MMEGLKTQYDVSVEKGQYTPDMRFSKIHELTRSIYLTMGRIKRFSLITQSEISKIEHLCGRIERISMDDREVLHNDDD